MDLFFEMHILTLQYIQTDDLTDEERAQLLAPTSTIVFQLGKSLVAWLGQRRITWGRRVGQIAAE
jgi:hypothetical protein